MKKLIFVLSLIGIISTGYGQKISTLVEDGDTIETLTNDSYFSLSELDGTPATVAIRLLPMFTDIDADVAALDTRVGVTEDMLQDSLGLYVHEYYVATDGNDSNSGLSQETAWLTVAHACSQVTKGTIYIGEGAFVETGRCMIATGVSLVGAGRLATIIQTNYTTDDYTHSQLTLTSASEGVDGSNTISHLQVDGNSLTGLYGVYIAGRSNVVIHDCIIKDYTKAGVTYNGRTDITGAAPTTYATGNKFYNNTLTNCSNWSGFGRGGLQIGGQEGMLIYNDTITQVGRADGTNGYVIKYFDNGYLKGVKIYDNYIEREPWYSYGTFNFAIELWNILGGLEIYNNEIIGNTDINLTEKGVYSYAVDFHHNTVGNTTQCVGVEVGFQLESGTAIGCNDVRVRQNYFRNLQFPIYFFSQANSIGYDNIDIYGNVFDGIGKTAGGGFGFYHYSSDDSSTPINDVDFYNNTFYARYGADASYGIVVPQNATTTNFCIDNNVFYGFTAANIYSSSEAVGASIDTISIQNNVSYDNGNSNDPLFSVIVPTNVTGLSPETNIKEDPLFVSTSDFTLQTGSPAIDAGIERGVTADYNDKPILATPDIGAYENQFVRGYDDLIVGGDLTVGGNFFGDFPDSIRNGDLGVATDAVARAMLVDSIGWFNVVSYGADPTGSGNPATGFQAAMDAAAAQTYGGVVYIPAGTYTFDTDSVELRSNVTVKADDKARFYVPPGHTNTCVFHSENYALSYFNFEGGRFFSGLGTADMFKISEDGSGLYFMTNCSFRNINCVGANNMFNFYTDDFGWINGNHFTDLWCENSRAFLKTRDPNGTGGGIAANMFTNVQIQANALSETVLDSLTSGRNQFLNFMVWDWSGGVKGKTVVLTEESTKNILSGSWVADSVVDNGTQNTIIDVDAPAYFGNSVKSESYFEAGDYGARAQMIVKEVNSFIVEGEAIDTIIYLPYPDVVWDIKLKVTEAYDDSGYDYIKIGTSDLINRFYDNLDVSTTGWKDLSGSMTNIPYESATRYIAIQYYGENDNATEGILEVYIEYSTH